MSSFGTAASANPWVRVLDALEKKVNRNSYETWLKPTRYDHAQGAILFVRVPNPEFCQIGERYGDLISEAIENLGLEFQDVEFVTDEEQRTNSQSPRAAEPRHEPLPISDKPGPGPVTQQRFDWDGAAQLNPKYTFDDFVIGLRQSICPRRSAGGGREALQGLQPAVPVWRRRNGQDSPDAGHRARDQVALTGKIHLLCLQRALHQRHDQRAAL